MKTNFSILRSCSSTLVALCALGTTAAYPVVAQETTSTTLGEYSSHDISSEMTAGPQVNVRQLSNSPSPEGSGGREIAPNRYRMLRPPVINDGPVVDRAPATPLDTSAAGHSFFRGFTGLTQLDQRLSNGGNQFTFEPPDQGLAVGNNFVMEAVNDAINIYDTNGVQQLVRPLSLNEFFGLPPQLNRTTGVVGVVPTDPSCLFDPETQRWFVMMFAQLNTRNGVPLRESRLYLAVSQTSDPTGVFSIYVFNSTNPDRQGGPRVPDFPHFAVDRYGLYIGANEFFIDRNGNLDGFLGSSITAISKDALLKGNGGHPPRRVERFALPFFSGFEFTIWPAYTPPGSGPVLTNNGTQYFVSSQFVRNNEHALAVWALTNTSSLNTPTPALKLKATVVQTQAYHFPSVHVTQKDGFHPLGKSLGEPVPELDPGDFRILSATFVSGRLWCTLNSEMMDANGDEREVAAYFALLPQINGGSLSATVATQGVVSRTGVHLLRPAIAVNSEQQGAIVFTLVGPNDYPSSAFAAVSGNSVGPIRISAAGKLPEDGFTGYPEFSGDNVARWGDYSAATINNVDNTIWMGTEYIDNLPRTSSANWDTYITRFHP